MKKIILALISTILMGTAFYSCSPSEKDILKNVTSILTPYVGTQVELKDGVLTLSGKVESDSIKEVIAKQLQSVKGVKSVVNNLEVPPAIVINPDVELNSLISAALTGGGFSGVMAQVKDGEVILTGDLKKADLKKVMQLVNESKPRKVINQLKLK